MIISFNPTIFQTQDPGIQLILADILVELIKDKQDHHFIDPKSISSIFFDNENNYVFHKNNISQLPSSPKEKYLQDYISNYHKPITQLHRTHLTHLTIGTDSGEIHPKDALTLLTERPQIIVENAINDRKFIQGISQKYSSSRKRGSIYVLISNAIKRETIDFDNAGGSGEIKKRIQNWINSTRYSNIHKYKLMAIFDSDKTHINDFIEKYRKLIEFLKNRPISKPPENNDIKYEDNDLIIWHILYKREIENYIPLCILFDKVKQITETQKHELKNTTIEDLDFIEYNYNNIGISEATIKQVFPEMFLENFSYRDIEQRCEHHKVFVPEANELVSEIEQILLKIAKII